MRDIRQRLRPRWLPGTAALLALALLGAACGNRALSRLGGVEAFQEGVGQGAAGGPRDQGLASGQAGVQGGAAGLTGPAQAGTTGPAGPSGGETGVTGRAGAAGAAGGARGTIVVGGVFHRSGALRSHVEPCYRGVAAFIADANARGGINGFTFKFVAYDDGMDSSRTPTLMKRLIDVDRVDVLLGNCSDFGAEAVRQMTIDANLPVIGPVNIGSGVWYTTPNWFPVYGDQRFLYPLFVVETMKRHGIKRAGILWPNIQTGKEGAAQARRYIRQAGIDIVYDSGFSIIQPDFTPYVSRMKGAGVDGCVCIVSADMTVRLMQAAKQQDWKAKIYGPWPSYTPAVPKLGPYVDGVLYPNMPHLSLDTARSRAGVERLRGAMARYFPGQLLESSLIQGWMAGEVFEEALKRLGSRPFTKDGLLVALRTFRGWTGTFNPPLTYVNGSNEKPAMCNQVLVSYSSGFRVIPPTLHCAASY